MPVDFAKLNQTCLRVVAILSAFAFSQAIWTSVAGAADASEVRCEMVFSPDKYPLLSAGLEHDQHMFWMPPVMFPPVMFPPVFPGMLLTSPSTPKKLLSGRAQEAFDLEMMAHPLIREIKTSTELNEQYEASRQLGPVLLDLRRVVHEELKARGFEVEDLSPIDDTRILIKAGPPGTRIARVISILQKTYKVEFYVSVHSSYIQGTLGSAADTVPFRTFTMSHRFAFADLEVLETTLLHEARHMKFARDRELRRQSPYHGAFVGWEDAETLPFQYYKNYFSLEELSTFDRQSKQIEAGVPPTEGLDGMVLAVDARRSKELVHGFARDTMDLLSLVEKTIDEMERGRMSQDAIVFEGEKDQEPVPLALVKIVKYGKPIGTFKGWLVDAHDTDSREVKIEKLRAFVKFSRENAKRLYYETF